VQAFRDWIKHEVAALSTIVHAASMRA
jgi:hypothetical protein